MQEPLPTAPSYVCRSQGPWGQRVTQTVHTQGDGRWRPRGLWSWAWGHRQSLGVQGRPPGGKIHFWRLAGGAILVPPLTSTQPLPISETICPQQLAQTPPPQVPPHIANDITSQCASRAVPSHEKQEGKDRRHPKTHPKVQALHPVSLSRVHQTFGGGGGTTYPPSL